MERGQRSEELCQISENIEKEPKDIICEEICDNERYHAFNIPLGAKSPAQTTVLTNTWNRDRYTRNGQWNLKKQLYRSFYVSVQLTSK